MKYWNIHLPTFLPPFIILVLSAAYSIVNPAGFLTLTANLTQWIVHSFDFWFAAAALFFLLVVVAVYITPLGTYRLGGKESKPVLTKPKWFAITLCTTIATGILFWGTAEPLFHRYQPPEWASSPDGMGAAPFAISTLMMHWSFVPYAIYTVAGLTCALVLYRYRKPFSVGSLLFPLLGDRISRSSSTLLNIICLFSLIAGMAASLGAGILTISQGMAEIWSHSNFNASVWALVLIGCLFIASSVSGLLRGIQYFSFINLLLLCLLLIVILAVSPIREVLNLIGSSTVEFTSTFFTRNVRAIVQPDDWHRSWTVFNWANWMAWAPITALFLGKISKGYTVREFIRFNLLYPSLFSMIWMGAFGSLTLIWDQSEDYWTLLQSSGPESVIFTIMNHITISKWLPALFLVALVLSYVTAADSNTTAMAEISYRKPAGIGVDRQGIGIKILWGVFICLLAWVMSTYAGVDGIKMASNIGGLPVLFLLTACGLGLVRLIYLDWRQSEKGG